MYPFTTAPMADYEPDVEVTEYSSRQELWEEVKNLRSQVVSLQNDVTIEKHRAELAIDAHAIDKKPILIVNGEIDQHTFNGILSQWSKLVPNGIVIAMPPDMTLNTVDDQDLSQIGLKRVARGPVTDQELYDAEIIRCSG